MPGLNDRANIEAFLSAHDPIVEPTLYAVGDEGGVWKIAAFLGRGGSGEVYCVTHRQLGVVAAMKILSRDDDAARDRFRRETRILAEHSHPAFPRFHGYGERSDHAYLVIELLEAMPLPNKDREVARYLYMVCEGVAYLHGLGLVHRDVKPQNVLQRPDSYPAGVALPGGQAKRGCATNKVFMVPDDDHAKSYPKAGVFVGDHEVVQNF